MENNTALVNTTTLMDDYGSTVSQPVTLNLAYVLAAISFAIILLRTLIRRLNHEKYKLDDYVMFASMMLLAVVTATYPLVILNGNNIDVGGSAELSLEEIDRATYGSKFLLISRPFYMSYIWTMKACILMYYTRITSYTKEIWIIRGTGFVLAVTWLVFMLTFFLECKPVELYWEVLEEAPECAKGVVGVLVMAITDIATTLKIMAIPIPILKRVNLPTRTLLFLGIAYLVGTFVLLIPMVRLVFLIEESRETNLIWQELECFAATIVANAPIIHGLHRHAWGHIRLRKFGKNACVAPEPDLAVDGRETETLEAVSNDPTTKTDRARDHLRNSVREFKGRVRGSTRGLWDIKADVLILQESKTGRMDPNGGAEGPAGLDIFMGGGHGRGPVGQVSTEVFSDSSQGSKKSTFAWLKKGHC